MVAVYHGLDCVHRVEIRTIAGLSGGVDAAVGTEKALHAATHACVVVTDSHATAFHVLCRAFLHFGHIHQEVARVNAVEDVFSVHVQARHVCEKQGHVSMFR